MAARPRRRLPERPEVAPARAPFAPEPPARAREPGDITLFAPEGSAEGCASGECLPEPTATQAAPPGPAAASATAVTPAAARGPSPATSTAAAAPAPRPAPGASAGSATPVTAARGTTPSPAPGGAARGAAPSPPAQAASSPPHAAGDADDPDEEPPLPTDGKGPATDAEQWRRAVDAVRQASPRHGKSLSYARFLGFSPEGVRLAFPPDATFHRAQVTGMSRAMVEAELAKVLRRPVKLVEDNSAQALESAPRSIAEVEATDRASRERGIHEKVRAHPALRTVIKHLGGALEHVAYLEPVARPSAAAASPDEGDAGPAVD